MNPRTLATLALTALSLAACSRGKGSQTGGDSASTGVPPAPPATSSTAPAAPGEVSDSAQKRAHPGVGSDTMKHDSMKKDSTGM
jgi:hypothetical protein